MEEIKYRLKKEARNFFNKDLSKEIQNMDYWKSKTIHSNLLEEVEIVYVESGIEMNGRTDMSGWKSNNGNPESRFNFTIHIRDSNHREYQNLNTSDLLDAIQCSINSYMKALRSKKKI